MLVASQFEHSRETIVISSGVDCHFERSRETIVSSSGVEKRLSFRAASRNDCHFERSRERD
jgi:hypothetical protein